MAVLTVDALQHELDANGYLVVRGVVPREPLAQLAKELAVAYESAPKFQGGGSITGHLNCFPGEGARFVYEAVEEAGIVDAILAMRAGSSNAMRPTMNYNLPGSVAQHYHMDGLFTDDFLICNVAVIDTDLVNGAVDVLPGTQREFLPFWKYALHRTYRSSTRLEMGQGDVLLRKSMLWHRGMPNKSATPRPMMSMTFGERSAPDGEPLASFDGDIAFYPNWYSTSRAGRVREKTFAVAPITYSAYRFAKSLRGNAGYDAY